MRRVRVASTARRSGPSKQGPSGRLGWMRWPHRPDAVETELLEQRPPLARVAVVLPVAGATHLRNPYTGGGAGAGGVAADPRPGVAQPRGADGDGRPGQ